MTVSHRGLPDGYVTEASEMIILKEGRRKIETQRSNHIYSPLIYKGEKLYYHNIVHMSVKFQFLAQPEY